MPEPLEPPGQNAVNFELMAIRCERCKVGDITRTEAAAQAFMERHAGHRDDMAYLVKATRPDPFVGAVWWLRFTGPH